MNGVLQILEVIGRDASQENRDLIEKGRRAGQALMRILNGILDYSKLAQGATQRNPSIVSLEEVCTTVVDLHMAAAIAKGISLQSRLDLVPHSTHIKIDEVKLFEIINNLVSNAIKFTSSGLIELSVQVSECKGAALPKAELNIQVRDTGPGIPKAQQAKVFVPFFQGDTDTTNVTGGTGLGLAIVEELVNVLGGVVNLSSLESVGTVVRVNVPIEIASDSETPASERRDQTPDRHAAADVSLRGARRNRVVKSRAANAQVGTLHGHVLLIEDNELNAMLAARVLELFGLKVSVAHNGLVGSEQAVTLGPDIILMDCRMPTMDGFEATRRIREHEKRMCVAPRPIIGLTANALDGDRQKCLEAGMSDYLRKPYTAAELRVLLIRWLRKRATNLAHESHRDAN